MKTLVQIEPDEELRNSTILYQLMTNESVFSAVDLVRNFQFIPYQITLLNKTTLEDLIFVSYMHNLSANTTSLRYISETFSVQSHRLYIYYKSREVMREFNVTFNEIIISINLTKDEFLDSMINVIEKARRQLYIMKYVADLKRYRNLLLTFQSGLNVILNESRIVSYLSRWKTDELKTLDKNTIKQLLVKQNGNLFTAMLTIRNLSSFFETSLNDLKNMTVQSLLIKMLNISVRNYRKWYNFSDIQMKAVEDVKISTVAMVDHMTLVEITNYILMEKGQFRFS